MRIALPPAALGVLLAFGGAAALLAVALLAPERTMLVLPLLVLVVLALALYQIPVAFAAGFVLVYGLGLDIHVGGMGLGGLLAALGGAVVKVVPYALAASLVLRYGFSSAINWPFVAFAAIAGLSLAILPMGEVVGTGEMIRSFIGSAAPFALGFARAPHGVWTALVRGAALVPIISALAGLAAHVVGFYPAFDGAGRFQGLHSPPFLAGFCTTAIFAAVLEYLRGGFRPAWLAVGGLNLAVLLATQARAPLAAAGLFLLIVFFLSGPRVFPLRRKVDLAMGGMVPAVILLGPFLLLAMERFLGTDHTGGVNLSGRDIIWPYFIEAIEARPLFGFGLGAGKMIVDPEDPTIRLLGSNAAHNEYLRLSVDAGILGCAAIFGSIVAWIGINSREAPVPADRLVLRAALAAVLLHSGLDNTLIATTAVIQFTFFAAALARIRVERRAAAATARHHRRHGDGAGTAARGRHHRHRPPPGHAPAAVEMGRPGASPRPG
jgi:O-antigen ligase